METRNESCIRNLQHASPQLLGDGLEDILNAVCQTVLRKENNTCRELQLIMLSFMIYDHGEGKKTPPVVVLASDN